MSEWLDVVIELVLGGWSQWLNRESELSRDNDSDSTMV